MNKNRDLFVLLGLSDAELDDLRDIASIDPNDLEALIDRAGITTEEEFRAFMDSAGLWHDPEYAAIANDILELLRKKRS